MNTEIETALRFIPIAEIVKQRIFSRSYLHTMAKNGTIKIYKAGKRTYVDKTEFESIFKPMQ